MLVCYKCNNIGHTTKFCKNDRAYLQKKGDKNIVKETKVWRKKEEAETKSLIVQTTLLAHNEKDIWYVDGGCSRHMTRYETKFLTLKKYASGKVRFGGNTSAKVVGKSTLMLSDGKTKVENVLFVEGLNTIYSVLVSCVIKVIV